MFRPFSPQDIAKRPKHEPILGSATRGNANELARLESLLVVAGPGVDTPANQQATDQVLGRHAVRQFDEDEVVRVG